MDVHFGKYKFKSGNIPFTLFGKFDDKTDVLFRDSTDNLKTFYEIVHKSKFDKSLEMFYERLKLDNQVCSKGNFSTTQSMVILMMTVLFVKILA